MATNEPQPPTSGIDEDIPCPKCQYNLRGLTVPRCPECGFHFEWKDLPSFRPPPPPSWREGALGIAILVGGLPVAVILASLGPALLPLLVAIAVTFLLSGVQAIVEIVPARLCIGPITPRRFRAWWEGVLIGYGACAATVALFGHPFLLTPSDNDRVPGGFAWMMTATAVVSFAIQYAVVRRRLRRWDDPLPARSLLEGCLAAKIVIAAVWTLVLIRWPFLLL